MEFFIKNPKIEQEVVYVQGQKVDAEAALAGDEFAPFANPKTFPGQEPKLLRVPFEKLSPAQVEKVRHLVNEQAQKSPKHMGVIRSSQFMVKDTGGIQVKEEAKVSSGALQEKPIPKASKGKPIALHLTVPKKERALADVLTPEEMIDAFPGITEKNVKKVFKQFKTLEAMSQGSNSEFTKAGVQSNFIRRIRDKCKILMRKGE